MSYIYKSHALPWSVYKELMHRMDEYIAMASDHSRAKYARYQTIIAIGCHLGPKAKELLAMRWSDVLQVGSYIFKLESHRSALVMDHSLKELIYRNYRIVQPSFIQQYILLNPTANDRPVIARQFNTALTAIFKRFDVAVPAPSCITFCKTFAVKIWIEYG